MISLTLNDLRRAIPGATKTRAEQFLAPLNKAMRIHGIDTRMRAAHFLAQIAWESGSLRYTEEIASGAAYDTGRLAAALGNTPQKDGDGQRYKGRGLIQVTGRANYKLYGLSIGKDMEDTSLRNWLLLREPVYAADSAAWFWEKHDLNGLADFDEFTKITRIINGARGERLKKEVAQRLPHLRNAKIALGLSVPKK